MNLITPMRVALLIVAAVLTLAMLFSLGSLVEFLDSGHIMVIQYPRGTLRVATDPGPYAQWFGAVTKYNKREQFWFTCNAKQDDKSLPVTFNDGGRGRVCGTIAWEMPSDPKSIIGLHIRYRSQDAIDQQLVRPVISKAVTFAGPLMSSTESYAARKSDLLYYIEDQIVGGVYRTQSQQIRYKDEMSGVERTVTQVTILKDGKGQPQRQDASPLDEFGIRTFNLVIDNIAYDKTVEDQIRQQQGMFAKVATAIAEAKEAEQRAITAEKNGQAEAAKAKWAQEAIKATEVTKAEQTLAVATLAARTAEQYKRQQILEGEGDAEKRKLYMAADNALDRRLEAYVKTQEVWAKAFGEYRGQVVPSIVSGSGAAVQGNAAMEFMGLMGMKAAKDLAVEVNPRRPQ